MLRGVQIAQDVAEEDVGLDASTSKVPDSEKSPDPLLDVGESGSQRIGVVKGMRRAASEVRQKERQERRVSLAGSKSEIRGGRGRTVATKAVLLGNFPEAPWWVAEKQWVNLCALCWAVPSLTEMVIDDIVAAEQGGESADVADTGIATSRLSAGKFPSVKAADALGGGPKKSLGALAKEPSRRARWLKFLRDPTFHARLPTTVHDKMTPFARLCLVRAVASGTMMNAVAAFVKCMLGQEFTRPIAFDIRGAVTRSSCAMPIVLLLTPGADVVAALRAELRLDSQQSTSDGDTNEGDTDPVNESMVEEEDSVRTRKTTILSMGRGQGPRAEAAWDHAARKGEWLLLVNCHLAGDWTAALAARVASLAVQRDSGELHSDFRVFITTMPVASFPSTVLQSSLTLTYEPARGMRALVEESLAVLTNEDVAVENFAEELTDCPILPAVQALALRLLYGLALFHVILVGRMQFGPLGFNETYDWSIPDFTTGRRMLLRALGEKFTELARINNLLPADAGEDVMRIGRHSLEGGSARLSRKSSAIVQAELEDAVTRQKRQAKVGSRSRIKFDLNDMDEVPNDPVHALEMLSAADYAQLCERLQFVIGTVVYGGRVTDAQDQRVLDSLFGLFVDEKFVRLGYASATDATSVHEDVKAAMSPGRDSMDSAARLEMFAKHAIPVRGESLSVLGSPLGLLREALTPRADEVRASLAGSQDDSMSSSYLTTAKSTHTLIGALTKKEPRGMSDYMHQDARDRGSTRDLATDRATEDLMLKALEEYVAPCDKGLEGMLDFVRSGPFPEVDTTSIFGLLRVASVVSGHLRAQTFVERLRASQHSPTAGDSSGSARSGAAGAHTEETLGIIDELSCAVPEPLGMLLDSPDAVAYLEREMSLEKSQAANETRNDELDAAQEGDAEGDVPVRDDGAVKTPEAGAKTPEAGAMEGATEVAEQSGVKKSSSRVSARSRVASSSSVRHSSSGANASYDVFMHLLESEVEAYDHLLHVLQDSLNNLREVMLGHSVMTADLADVQRCLLFNEVPKLWKDASYPTLFTARDFVADLRVRVKFMRDWIMSGKPAVMSLGCFFHPRSLITALLQAYAGARRVPLDAVRVDVCVPFGRHRQEDGDGHGDQDGMVNEITTPPENGVYVRDLWVECGKWDDGTGRLVESRGSVAELMPVVWFCPVVDTSFVEKAPQPPRSAPGADGMWPNPPAKDKPSSAAKSTGMRLRAALKTSHASIRMRRGGDRSGAGDAEESLPIEQRVDGSAGVGEAGVDAEGTLYYSCPIYVTSKRAGALATSGVSDNYLLSVSLPIATGVVPAHYVRCSVALIVQKPMSAT